MQQQRQVFAKKTGSQLLITAGTAAQPEEMKVIWHQAIHGAYQVVACTCMKHQLTEPGMEGIVKPPCGSVLDRVGPKDKGECLVEGRIQTRQTLREPLT